MMSQNKLFFDHIPKTAGTSLQQFFVEAFGEGMVTTQGCPFLLTQKV
jgi:hypothetical protein